MLVAYLYVLIIGIMLWIAGSETLTEQVRQSLPPNEVESWQEELRSRRLWGQTLILVCAMIAVVLVI
jgi:hypothetical protein